MCNFLLNAGLDWQVKFTCTKNLFFWEVETDVVLFYFKKSYIFADRISSNTNSMSGINLYYVIF